MYCLLCHLVVMFFSFYRGIEWLFTVVMAAECFINEEICIFVVVHVEVVPIASETA